MIKKLVAGTVLLLSSLSTIAAPSPEVLKREFVELMVKKHQFSEDYVVTKLAQAKKQDSILKSITTPWESKPWHQYRSIFLTDERIDKGVLFWQQYEDTLIRAEKELGVPAEIIVAILGVETYYGTRKGNHSLLDSLVTLGFHYPKRGKFFRKELEQLFLLTLEEKLDINALKGSYAGAMGWGQFISSSYRHYAVDFDGDGIRDLLNNPVDAIGSVANYFKKNGWQTGKPVAYPAKVNGNNYRQLLSKSLKFKHRWKELQDKGVSIDGVEQIAANTSSKLLAFEQIDGDEYWAGLRNFYVITRYNHSPLYAMAVFQLSEQIKQSKKS